MFEGAESFTSDLSQWQTGNVTDMSEMFRGAYSFTSDLSK
jgi:surface protein